MQTTPTLVLTSGRVISTPPSLDHNLELGILTQDDQALRKLYETFEGDWGEGEAFKLKPL